MKQAIDSGRAIGLSAVGSELEGETLAAPEFAGTTAETAGLRWTRSIRVLPGGFALALTCKNLRSEPVRLKRINVLQIAMDSFPGTDFSRWRVFKMARQKNDIPGFFTPSKTDDSFEDVVFDSSEVRAGAGISYDDFAGNLKNLPCRVTSDPGLVVLEHEQAQPLLVAFIGQDRHLNEVTIETTADRKRLLAIEAWAAFDGALLLPGKEVRTHELAVRSARGLPELLEWHADAVGTLYGVKPPSGKKPAVFCSWYFYGEDIRESDVVENLAALRQHPIPFDVFQIDHGWSDTFGDWRANGSFPGGLDHLAGMIRDAGYTPGIWTAPFVLEQKAEALVEFPDLVLRNGKGEPVIFKCAAGDCYVLDPCAPNAETFLSRLYGRLKKHGFMYHKLDFVRAIILTPDVRYHDGTKNRAQAYRIGIELIRKAVGEDSYFEVCGGLYEGSAGLANATRSSMDVRGEWAGIFRGKPNRINGYLLRIKQNVLRNHYNRLWHTDPDALQVRRRTEPFRNNKHVHLSSGTFNDEEAFSIVVNQFLGGGLVCLSDQLSRLDADRRALYRHVIPQYAGPARAVNPVSAAYCPDLFVSRFDTPPPGLAPWIVATIANWSEETATRRLDLASLLPSDWGDALVAAFEFREQRFLGLCRAQDSLTLTLPPHSCRLVRLTRCAGAAPLLIGTDLSLSQGMEIGQWNVAGTTVTGRLHTPWTCQVTLTLLTPNRSQTETLSLNGPSAEFRWSPAT